MKNRKVTMAFVGVVICLLGLTLVVSAWEPNSNEAPHQGAYTYSRASGGMFGRIVSRGYNIKWTQAAINAMNGDGTGEWLDQTADCTDDSPTGDRLHALSHTTNIPNNGMSIYNDCDSATWKEEAELQISSGSLNTTSSYWFNMTWNCAYPGASGDLNISFEASSLAHDWLDKVQYSCNPFAQNNTNDEKADNNITNEQELIREVNNDIYTYQLIRTSHGKLRVRINVNFLNKEIFEAFQSHNELLLDNFLSEQVADDAILVAITFISPLSNEEGKLLTQNLQMKVISYGILGSVDKEVVSSYFSPISYSIEDFVTQQTLEGVGNVTYDGIMTITGIIDSNALKILSENQNVMLLDLTANEIQKSEMDNFGQSIDLEQIGIPNPAWQIYTGKVD